MVGVGLWGGSRGRGTECLPRLGGGVQRWVSWWKDSRHAIERGLGVTCLWEETYGCSWRCALCILGALLVLPLFKGG